MESVRGMQRQRDNRTMGRRPMTPSSRLVVRDRVHAHPLLSVLPPKKLRELRCARSQQALSLAVGDGNRACVLRGIARSCT